MTRRNLDDALGWAEQGTKLFLGALAELGDDELEGPSALPGWTRKHLVAHLAGNAQALLNLAHWAATGEETPMYSSPDQRRADIEGGAQRPAKVLRAWVEQSAVRLDEALAALDASQWQRPVRTAQGRTVPAREIPWLRAREVMVHSVDLDTVIDFSDLPMDFLLALIDDVVAKRSADDGAALTVIAEPGEERWSIAGVGTPVGVRGSIPRVAAYLAGRGDTGIATSNGSAVPVLPPWL
jgi:maleylpyruvate isomerase